MRAMSRREKYREGESKGQTREVRRKLRRWEGEVNDLTCYGSVSFMSDMLGMNHSCPHFVACNHGLKSL